MDIIVSIVAISFLALFIIFFAIMLKYDKWCKVFLNKKYSNIKKSNYNDLLLLYKKLSLVDKIKFRYLVVYCDFLYANDIELSDANEVK